MSVPGPPEPFGDRLRREYGSLTRSVVDTVQINLGKLCNQACLHCHVDAGPQRTEIMSRDMADLALDFTRAARAGTVDLTGGAPELNPSFRALVEANRRDGRHVIDRCNLTVLFEPGLHDLAEFLAAQRVEIIASLPCYSEENVTAQRGGGVYAKSIRALRKLNALGYGHDGSGLTLKPDLQSGRPQPAAPAAGSGGGLQARVGRPFRHRLQPPVHADEHADCALCARLGAGRHAGCLSAPPGARLQPRHSRRPDVPPHGQRFMGRLSVRLRLQPDARPAPRQRRPAPPGRPRPGRPGRATRGPPYPARHPLLRLHRGAPAAPAAAPWRSRP